VQEPTAQPFKYVPSLNETKIDEDIWRELENLDMSDAKRKKTKPKAEIKSEPKAEAKSEPPKEEKKKAESYNYDKEEKKNPSEAPEGVARKLPTETKWSKPVEEKKSDWPSGDIEAEKQKDQKNEFQW
jgi:hypothetical protein